MKRLLLVTAAVGLLMNGALAQDPLKVAPQAYKMEFENDWVKVVRVHYPPHAKIPAHDHTQMASAYVYLNDGGPVIFKHIGLAYGDITRPATKAGSFRVYKAVKETHEVENPNDTPSHFLRVEFKTEPLGEKTLRGRFHREAYPAGENYRKVQFENEQIRITRLVCAPHQKLDVSASAAEPTLLVALTPARFKAVGQKGKSSRLSLDLGRTKWLRAGQQEELENLGEAPAELLRFEFKTKPIETPDKKADQHRHAHN